MTPVRTILADDHAVVRAGIANALRELSNIEIAAELSDGGALLATLERLQPELLVTDVTMPNFEPISDIRQIRARFPALKILVVSAYDDDVYVQGMLGVGVNGYHLKDQPLGDLRLAVQRVLAGERWVCSPLVEKLVRAREAVPISSPLTSRQHDLLRCLQEGLDNQAIARQTGLSVKTVENHLTRLYRQINVQSRLEAVTYLAQHPGLLTHHLGSVSNIAASAPGISGNIQEHILIVDDNMRYRSQMRRMISKSFPNIHMSEAHDIASALRQVDGLAPQLTFIDVVLGDESGIECTRLLKHRTPATRVVLISAYPDREFHRQGLEAGAVALLDKKDLNAAVLRELINDLMV